MNVANYASGYQNCSICIGPSTRTVALTLLVKWPSHVTASFWFYVLCHIHCGYTYWADVLCSQPCLKVEHLLAECIGLSVFSSCLLHLGVVQALVADLPVLDTELGIKEPRPFSSKYLLHIYWCLKITEERLFKIK